MPSADNEYQLLDSGNLRRLERLGPYVIDRPALQAVWEPALPVTQWKRADAVYERSGGDDGGKWKFSRKIDRDFDMLFGSLMFHIKLTNFGHLGLFPEQLENWDWLRRAIRERLRRTNDRNLYVLNLFGYTGGSTLAASQAGAHLVHVDAAKGVVDWARKNAQLSGLVDRPIRWIVDDALKFVKREERRGHVFQGVILDPPTFGRGPQGEVFKIEDDLVPLLQAVRAILAKDALFVLYSCHTPGFTPITLENQLAIAVDGRGGHLKAAEMTVCEERGADKGGDGSGGRLLPSGVFARWQADT
jgi:23S rRNA (cytosine1962-C5)-methyltransferase